MAKPNNFIIAYSEKLKNVKLDTKNKGLVKVFITKFINYIDKNVEDPRYEKMCDYPLETIIVTAFLALLSNCNTWGEIAAYANDYYDDLKKYLKFSSGRTPIDDTYRRVFSLLNIKSLAASCAEFILSFYKKIEREATAYFKKHNIDGKSTFNSRGMTILNIDGKEARSTGRYYNDESKKIKNMQTLNIYDATYGVVISSIPISSKENEIPVAQDFLNSISLTNTIVTFDALHCHHATFHAIVGKNKSKDCGDFVITLKENQKILYEIVKDKYTDSYLEKLKENDKRYSKLGEKEFYMTPFQNFNILIKETKEGYQEWEGVRNIICYTHINKKTGELMKQFFVTSLNDLELIVEAIIRRWDVENKLHYNLDVYFRSDDDKTMDVNAFNNLETIKKLANSFLSLVTTTLKRGKKMMRQSFNRKTFSYLYSLTAILNFDTIEKVFNEEIEKINSK